MAIRDIVVSVTLAVDTEQFTPGDLMGQAAEAAGVCESNHTAFITSLTLYDDDLQGGDLDVFLFRSDPGSLGVVNAPLSLSAAQKDLLFGVIHIGADRYSQYENGLIARVQGSDLAFVPIDGTSVWLAAVSRFPSLHVSGQLKVGLGVKKQTD
jgi:hypothetical protein